MEMLTKEHAREMFGDEEYEYFVAFLDPTSEELMHLCGYGVRPKVQDLVHLFKELVVDKDFGMPADYVDTLKVRIFQFKDD